MRFLRCSIIIFFFLACVKTAYAVSAADVSAGIREALPGSVAPARVNENLTPPPELPTYGTHVTTPKEAAETALNKEAQRIKFKLTKIILEGNRIYSDAQLETIYRSKLNTIISIAELQNIVQEISNYYRNNGYILSRAILPAQHVKNGVVHVRILEGTIDKVRVIGTPKGAKSLIFAYGKHIADTKPVNIDAMTYYLRIINEIPGVSSKAVLEPSKNVTGASDMDLVTNTATFTGYLSYDDYGTRYMGPQETTVGGQFNSIFRAGDATYISYVTTARPLEMRFIDFSNDTPVGTHGKRFQAGINNALTRPGFVLTPLDLAGDAFSIYGNFKMPMVRTATHNFTLNAGYNYLDSGMDLFHATPLLTTTLYLDHIRAVNLTGMFDFTDRFYGANLLNVMIEQGLNILGASNNPNSPTISRPDGHGVYTRFTLQFNRLQQIKGPFSAFLNIKGQDALEPLLTYAQFGYGGSQLGRGYDPAEIIGDKGAGGSLELRMDFNPHWSFLLQSTQFYIFYDAGVIWNIKHLAVSPIKQSAMSTGFGIRFILNKYISGNIMIAQPLTKKVATNQILGNGKQPREFFSVVASFL